MLFSVLFDNIGDLDLYCVGSLVYYVAVMTVLERLVGYSIEVLVSCEDRRGDYLFISRVVCAFIWLYVYYHADSVNNLYELSDDKHVIFEGMIRTYSWGTFSIIIRLALKRYLGVVKFRL